MCRCLLAASQFAPPTFAPLDQPFAARRSPTIRLGAAILRGTAHHEVAKWSVRLTIRSPIQRAASVWILFQETALQGRPVQLSRAPPPLAAFRPTVGRPTVGQRTVGRPTVGQRTLGQPVVGSPMLGRPVNRSSAYRCRPTYPMSRPDRVILPTSGSSSPASAFQSQAFADRPWWAPRRRWSGSIRVVPLIARATILEGSDDL